MPVRRGHVAPRNVFIDNLIRRLNVQGRVFCVANARLFDRPIIYCSGSLLSLTGHRRGDVMGQPARCDFLRGPGTTAEAAAELAAALEGMRGEEEAGEQRVHTVLHRKDGSEFECDCVVTPVRSQQGGVEFYIISFHLHQGEVCYSGRDSILARAGLGDRRVPGVFRRLLEPPALLAAPPPSVKSETALEAPSGKGPEADQSGSEGHRRRLKSGSEADSTAGAAAADTSVKKSWLNVTPGAEAIVIPGAEADDEEEFAGTADAVASTRSVTKAVAQVLSLDSGPLPGYKLQRPSSRTGPIFLHYSVFKAVWDWLVLILVSYTAVYTPYVATFLLMEDRRTQREEKSTGVEPMSVVDAVVDVMFIIDIFINFRTTYVNKKDEVVCDPKKIAVHYLKGWFFLDLIAALPFDLVLLYFDTGSDEMATLIGLFKTARLLRLVRVARKLDRYSEYGTAVLVLLMASFALVAHWMACVWYAIGVLEQTNNRIGWLDALADQIREPYIPGNSSSGPSLRSKYITSLYFVFSSLTSVGFGNVSPNTNWEKAFGIAVMVAGSLMYASIFGNVAAIIQRLYSGSARYHSQLMRVREFVRFHQIPELLSTRLEEHFQHAWARTNGIDMDLVLRAFPDCLQADVCLHMNSKLLADCPAFRTAGPGCLRAVASRIRTTNVPPGDIVLHKGDLLTDLYFVASGSLEILKDASDSVLAILGPGDVFGEALLSDGADGSASPACPRCSSAPGRCGSTVRALALCELRAIAIEDLRHLLDAYPELARGFVEGLDVSYRLRDSGGCDHHAAAAAAAAAAASAPAATSPAPAVAAVAAAAVSNDRLDAMEAMLDRLEARLGRLLRELDGREFA